MMGCSGSGGKPGETRVTPVATMADFNAVIDNTSTEMLVMIDFYADWCAPCQQLSPIIDKLSVSHADRVAVYKVDVDRLSSVLERYGIRAIPLVMFFKNGQLVRALPGLQPESAYRDAIKSLS
jgi:thioredoxin